MGAALALGVQPGDVVVSSDGTAYAGSFTPTADPLDLLLDLPMPR